MNIVAHNLIAMNTQRQYGILGRKQAKATEKLSSGYKINRAADDAAGLAMSEKMRRQIRGLSRASENIQDGIGYVQTADGALNEAQDMLHRMNELAVKAANGTLTSQDRQYIDSEVQQLKSELDRIFSTTTFNEEKIWDPDDSEKVLLGYESKQAATFRGAGNYVYYDTTNANCDVLAADGYKVNADADGVYLSWTGYDGQPYETEKMEWADLEANNYVYELSDHFGDPTDGVQDNLYDTAGNPVFKYQIALDVEKTATYDDIKEAINGTYVGISESTDIIGQFEDSSGTLVSKDASIIFESVNYGALYASNANGTEKTADIDGDGVDDAYGYDFDAADDKFLEAADDTGTKLTSGATTNLISYPQATTVADAETSTEKWKFSFKMDGIGTVTAESKSITYESNDRDDEDEHTWWEWDYYYSGNNKIYYREGKERTRGTGTLGDVMSVLTGEKDVDTDTPGLLNKTNADGKGAADSGGYIDINFDLTSPTYAYGNSSSTYVGSFSIRFQVSNTDTQQTVLDKINNVLNSNTILDFYTNSATAAQQGRHAPYANTKMIDVPIYGGTNRFYVQAGVESGEHIGVEYECLSVLALGMEDTNVLTVEDAENTIGEVKKALEEISTQRAAFGAYQNRLEHAYNANRNTEENTTASESVIRDTDMAKAMVEYSNYNILLQAGQAMMAQANQSNQGVLSLLS